MMKRLSAILARVCGSALLLLCALLCAAGPALAQKALNGVALVIGQSDYEHIAKLPNPANDAREMVKLLTDLGFDARGVTDRDTARLARDLDRFAEDAEEADVALVYYSGHAIEAGGENWLIPVDAGASALEAAATSLVPLSQFLDRLKAVVPVTIVLLDACRTNPFPHGTVLKASPGDPPSPVGQGGLSAIRGATSLAAAPAQAADNLGQVIGFAAEPGQPALDGAPGGNSPYATAILRHLAVMQGVEFGQVMRMVTEEVYLATGARQRPWTNESLRRLLYFGAAPDEPEGADRAILGERRQLLLTMSELPEIGRIQVEKVALREGVKLDSLYGILRALGEDRMPDDPGQLDALLKAQAARLREMTGQRAALRTDDPQIAALSEAADRAIAEGAILAARTFLDQAVARVEESAVAVDDLEAQLKDKRIADAAIYARRADAAGLGFDYALAAADYGKAFELVERWDERLAWNYRNQEAEALRSLGEVTGTRAPLEQALAAYQTVLDMVPNGDRGRDWAITRNNMAVVLNTMGERATGTTELEEALAIFRETGDIFTTLGDEASLASSRNNVGNILVALGERSGDADLISDAVAAYRAALEMRPRATLPFEWAESQNNLGIAISKLADLRPGRVSHEEAEAAYRAALEVFTSDAAPVDRAMVQNNLGNTLAALGLQRNSPDLHRQSIAAFEEALAFRTPERWPFEYASTMIHLGNGWTNLARHELGIDSLRKARTAYHSALAALDRKAHPLEWASAKNNLGSALQTIGQRESNLEALKESADALRDARDVYRRDDFPLDWAMTQNNLGNTFHLMGTVASDPKYLRDAVAAFRQALREYRRERTPMQWAFATAGMGNSLQSLANHEDHTRSLHGCVEARRTALEVMTPDNAPVEWATAQNGLGTCLLNLANREQKPDYLHDASTAFEASTQVFTRQSQPLQWAFAQNNIGDVHWTLAAYGGGEAEYRRALDLFEQAKEGFATVGYLPLIELVDRKIELIREALAK